MSDRVLNTPLNFGIQKQEILNLQGSWKIHHMQRKKKEKKKYYKVLNGKKHSRTDQVKFVEDHTSSNFLKAVFRKFYLVFS